MRPDFQSSFFAVWILLTATVSTVPAAGTDLGPLPMVNRKAGISASFSGVNGKDWVVEHGSHNMAVGDTVIYLKSRVKISLLHNAGNIYSHDSNQRTVLGEKGPDGKENSPDDGVIHYILDRDVQAHAYVGDDIPAWAPAYKRPIDLQDCIYDGNKKVMGSFGDNVGTWGSKPLNTNQRCYYGQTGPFGNEWHTLTYWDDDTEVYKTIPSKRVDKREKASDGHFLAICVNPKTPVLQFVAESGADEFYTTPAKTYHVPVIRPQTTYCTGGVKLRFFNLINNDPVFFRIDNAEWRPLAGTIPIRELVSQKNRPVTMEARIGKDGPVMKRRIVMDPDYPAKAERHGYMLWKDDAEFETIRNKLKTSPFKESYAAFKGAWYQGGTALPNDLRGPWREGSRQCGLTLANAFVVKIGGPDRELERAKLAKERLLRAGRLEPVGCEADANASTPGMDFLQNLGQTTQGYGNAGIAYDLLISCFRRDQHPAGISPIEEIMIREGLAKCAANLLRYGGNYAWIYGAGTVHWAHGNELAAGLIALAMPGYASSHYGVSGADLKTENTVKDANGQFWNPYPDQGVTWYQCVTDPAMKTPGHPNVVSSFRAEFIYTDDGYWTGPNYLQGNGDRYHQGPYRRSGVNVRHGGMANAECLAELVENAGYENPFTELTTVFDLVRRIRGHRNRPVCTTSYINRRLVNGWTPLKWDTAKKRYRKQTPSVDIAVLISHNRHYPAAANSTVVPRFLADLTKYHTGGELSPERKAHLHKSGKKFMLNAYALARCDAPGNLEPSESAEVNAPPFLKPVYKYVIKPGERIVKELIAGDLSGRPVNVSITGLPAGAVYDAETQTLLWQTEEKDAGVHLLEITAENAFGKTSRTFPVIVKTDADEQHGKKMGVPTAARVGYASELQGVKLSWNKPKPVGTAATLPVEAYFIYRDGALIAAVPAAQLSWIDTESITGGSVTRYNLSAVSASGEESHACEVEPAILQIPK